METNNIQAMKEQRAQLISNAKIIVDAADDDKRDLTPEEEQQVDSLLGQADDVADQADDAERKLRVKTAEESLHQSKRAVKESGPYVRSIRSPQNDKREMGNVLKAWMTYGTDAHRHTSLDTFRSADRMGVNVAAPQYTLNLNTRAQVEGTNSAGGYTVPQDFGDKIVEALKYFCPIRDYATVISSENGQSLPFPTNDDSGNLAAITAENSALSATDTVFAQKTLGAYNYKSMVQLSLELLQDSKFDLENYMARQLGLRIGRAQEADFMVGNGSSKPSGIVNNATATVTSWSTTYANLVSLYYSVDLAYRKNGKFFMSDTQAATIQGLLDSNNRPLLNLDRSFDDSGVPTLFGKEVVISNSIPTTGSGKKVIAFGDPTDFYIRDVASVQLIRSADRYVEYGLVAFIAWLRSDANWFGPNRALSAGTLA
jgi:HK97 family phage major capsid protein